MNITEITEKKDELMEGYAKLEADNGELRALNDELEESYNGVNKLNKNMKQMFYLTSKLNLNNIDNEGFPAELFNTSFQLIPEADFGILFTYKGEKIKVIDTIGVDIKTGFETGYKKELVNKLDRHIFVLNKSRGKLFRAVVNLGDRYKDIYSNIKEMIILNINTHQKEKVGIALCISKTSIMYFNDRTYILLRAFRELSAAFYRLEKYNVLQKIIRTDIMIAVVRMLELHDTYTKNHSESVAKIARDLAIILNLDDRLVEKTHLTGLVHDIGKVLIPFNVINKKGPLSDEEFSIIKKHPLWGYETLRGFEQLEDIAEYILYHHERWDGLGYPEGISGDDIPLISQIITIADAWDAMRTDRSYRKALTYNQSIIEIINGRGSQFSPVVVDVFLDYLKR